MAGIWLRRTTFDQLKQIAEFFQGAADRRQDRLWNLALYRAWV